MAIKKNWLYICTLHVSCKVVCVEAKDPPWVLFWKNFLLRVFCDRVSPWPGSHPFCFAGQWANAGLDQCLQTHLAFHVGWGGDWTQVLTLGSAFLSVFSLQPHWAVRSLRGEALFATLLLESWQEAKGLLHTAGATSSCSNWLLHRLRTLEPEDLYLNFYWKRSEAGKIVAFICERRIDTPKAYFCLVYCILKLGFTPRF